jgi:AraC-like DNA-binding protein
LGVANIVQTDHVTLVRFDMNRKVLQLGAGTPNYITFTIWEPTTLFTWRNFEMKRGMVGVLWDKEHESVTGAEFRGIPISIEENHFIKLCHKKGYEDLAMQIKKSEVLHVSEAELKKIRSLIRFVLEDESLDHTTMNNMIEEKLLDLFIDCLATAFPEKRILDLTHQKSKLVIDYIHDNISTVTSLDQVSQNTQIPERTIRRLINKKFQISPKQYINKLRLNEVRKGLKNNNCNSNIFQVASDFNYWHMSQFSKDYKLLFGELPSNTK